MKDKVKSRGSSLDNVSLSNFHMTVFHSDLTYHAHKMKQYFATYLIFILLFPFFVTQSLQGTLIFYIKLKKIISVKTYAHILQFPWLVS